MDFVDLHTHTRYSDGDWAPGDLVREAARLGLRALAVTDHDSMEGVVEALAAREELVARGEKSLEVIPGVEMTCQFREREVHILGYFDGQEWRTGELASALASARLARVKRCEQILEKLAGLGVRVSIEDVLRFAAGGAVGRPHIAMALVARGHVASMDSAFVRWLRRGRPAFVERNRMNVGAAIELIHRAGGVAVLAHPVLAQLDGRIKDLARLGLDGLEAWHSRQGPAQSRRYFNIARGLNLIVTGGSDCHGRVRGEPLLGLVKAPYTCVEAIGRRRSRIQIELKASGHAQLETPFTGVTNAIGHEHTS